MKIKDLKVKICDFTEFLKGGVYYRFYTGKTISTETGQIKGLV